MYLNGIVQPEYQFPLKLLWVVYHLVKYFMHGIIHGHPSDIIDLYNNCMWNIREFGSLAIENSENYIENYKHKHFTAITQQVSYITTAKLHNSTKHNKQNMHIYTDWLDMCTNYVRFAMYLQKLQLHWGPDQVSTKTLKVSRSVDFLMCFGS